MDSRPISGKETQRPDDCQEIQYLSLCWLQRTNNRFTKTSLYCQRGNDEDCGGNEKSWNKIIGFMGYDSNMDRRRLCQPENAWKKPIFCDCFSDYILFCFPQNIIPIIENPVNHLLKQVFARNLAF